VAQGRLKPAPTFNNASGTALAGGLSMANNTNRNVPVEGTPGSTEERTLFVQSDGADEDIVGQSDEDDDFEDDESEEDDEEDGDDEEEEAE
jgi:hypothetical protein